MSRIEDPADRVSPKGAASIATQAEQSAGWSDFAGPGQWAPCPQWLPRSAEACCMVSDVTML
ncbi:hypothetical protein GCM10007864_51580 [Sinorhizobium fredii]|nr:hypothetical protein GCM10007864_51580 [Sinorhizobium fredii]